MYINPVSPICPPISAYKGVTSVTTIALFPSVIVSTKSSPSIKTLTSAFKVSLSYPSKTVSISEAIASEVLTSAPM